jgi:hypothetical protein
MNGNSKIAALPLNVIEKLNDRLDAGQKGPQILTWLNALPEVRDCLRQQWQGVPVSKQKLSGWRNGGYRRWGLLGNIGGYSGEFSADHWDDFPASQVTKNLAMSLSARYAKILSTWDGNANQTVETELRLLRGITKDLALLHTTLTLADTPPTIECLQNKLGIKLTEHFTGQSVNPRRQPVQSSRSR